MEFSLKPYLLSLTTQGIKNITKPITIRFYKKKSLKNFNPAYDHVRAIYGTNGAGKTAIMTSVRILQQLLTGKDTITLLGSEYFSNILNKENPIFSISIDYAIIKKENNSDNYNAYRRYRYFIELDGTNKVDIKIISERLSVIKGQDENSILLDVFECKDGKVVSLLDGVKKTQSIFDIDLIKEKSLNIISKQSFVTFLLEYLIEFNKKSKEKKHFNDYEQNLYSIMLFSAFLKVQLANDDKHSEYFESSKTTIKNFMELSDNEMRIFLLEQGLDKAGEKTVVKKELYQEFEKFIKRQTKFIQLFKPELKSIEIHKIEGKDFYLCSRVMNYDNYSISVDFESTGIKRLLAIYTFLNAASEGKIVFIDEIDANLSGVYLQRLVEFLNIYGNGQLCFTAHSLDPMHVLSNYSKSIYFLNENSEILSRTKNANYKPYILYPEGMIKGISFSLEAFDFVKVFDC